MTIRGTRAPPSRIKRSQQVIERAEQRAAGAEVANRHARERNVREQGPPTNSAQNTRRQAARCNS